MDKRNDDIPVNPYLFRGARGDRSRKWSKTTHKVMQDSKTYEESKNFEGTTGQEANFKHS